MHTYTIQRAAELSRISATKLKTLWPIGSEGKWNPDAESSEQSHRYTMPRLCRRWCKAVIDSIHHCTYNLPRIEIICQLLSRNYFRLQLPDCEIIRNSAGEASRNPGAGGGVEPARQLFEKAWGLERASAKPA